MEERPSLTGRSILVVEDEILIVMDIMQAFEGTGAELTNTGSLEHALLLVEHDGLSGAIIDHGLLDGDSCQLRKRLKERSIPFIIYSGYRRDDLSGENGVFIGKPALPDVLVNTMIELIRAAEERPT